MDCNCMENMRRETDGRKATNAKQNTDLVAEIGVERVAMGWNAM